MRPSFTCLGLLFAGLFGLSACSDDTTSTSGQGGTTASGGGGGSGGSGGSGGGDGGGTGSGGSCLNQLPASGLYATFDVVGQTYFAAIDNPTGIQQAIELWTGQATAAIPNGTLVCSAAPYNCPWSFHQDPATIEFADFTTEVCDGTPEYVEDNCASFGAYYCPWSAVLVDLRDCRSDSSCPPVPK